MRPPYAKACAACAAATTTANAYLQDPLLWRPFITGPEKKEEADQSPEELTQTQAYYDSRSQQEQEDFRWALHNTMDLCTHAGLQRMAWLAAAHRGRFGPVAGRWYAHQGTTVYMLTRLPEGAKRKVGYLDSGWTTCEDPAGLNTPTGPI